MTPADPKRALVIPLILGTGREGRRSEAVARFVFSQLSRRAGVEAVFVDVRDLQLAHNGPGDETRDKNFAALCERADGFIIVAPEYNHGYPGLLKHALDMNLPEYNHKAVGICGVSAGPFGGARMIENLVPVTRELGLVPIGVDVNFGNAGKLFDASGNLLDENYIRRVDKFLSELIWMARVLRNGRETIPPE